MNKFCCLVVSFVLLLFFSCDSDPCEGVVADVITQQLYVEYVNAEGENLLTNGTYAAEEILVAFNGFSRAPFIYNDSYENVPQELQNRILLDVINLDDQPNIWTISLSANETDSLELFLSVESSGCSGTFYTIDDLKYNNTSLSHTQFNNENIYLVTVIK